MEPVEVTLLVRVLPVRVSVTVTVASVEGSPFGEATATLSEEVVCCANAAIGTVRNSRNTRKANEFRILVYILSCPPVVHQRHVET